MLNVKHIAKGLLVLCCLLLSPGAVWAQSSNPFTVLSNNTDTANRKLYVEIMYERPACGDYQAMFRLTDRSGLNQSVKIDAVLNNDLTYQLSPDSAKMLYPQAGGYRLRFDLSFLPTNKISLSDSLAICVDSYKLGYLCRGCGPGGSNPIFEPASIHPDCPYRKDELLACHQRQGEKANWEAWIQDNRDCKPYRIVMMPDGRWWFAQNLNYQEDLEFSGNADKGLAGATAVNTNNLFGNYWCPGGVSTVGVKAPVANTTVNTYGLQACETYGALYTWNTATRLRGRGAQQINPSRSAWSTMQGICPDGWYLPGDGDWGYLLNSLEGCDTVDLPNLAVPCNHLSVTTANLTNLGKEVLPLLKSTVSCPPHTMAIDSVCATMTTPAWAWRRADYIGKLAQPNRLGQDAYGMALQPAGYRYSNASTTFNFQGVGAEAYFWTVSENSSANAYYRVFSYATSPTATGMHAYQNLKYYGMSVRCVKPCDDGDGIIVPAFNGPLSDLNGTNTGAVTFTANVICGSTVDWYDAPTGGTLLKANSLTYTTTSPIRVYAQVRSVVHPEIINPVRRTAIAKYTYSYTAKVAYTINLHRGSYTFECVGAAGNNGYTRGGYGGHVRGNYAVTALDQAAYVYVGGKGISGWNGAGAGGARGGGISGAGAAGGGASDIRIGGTAVGNRVIVAGGGGGGGGAGTLSNGAATGCGENVQGGEQNAAGRPASGGHVHSATRTAYHGGSGGGGGGYRNGAAGARPTVSGTSCTSGRGGAAGGAGTGTGTGLAGASCRCYGCHSGGGGGGTHYIGGVTGGTIVSNAVNTPAVVRITPQ
jgi:uncharacterized protein (TIGR02145 family)